MRSDGFVFDLGPSWYWMPDVFEGLYQFFGRSASDFYKLTRLSPSFRIFFGQNDLLDIPSETEELYKVFENMKREQETS
jgi:phytoene desaturase